MTFDHLLANAPRDTQTTAIREILELVGRPGVISLAGGIPGEESFPMEILGELYKEVVEKYRTRAFQYDVTEGFLPLRRALVPLLESREIKVGAKEIHISSGAQGLLNAAARLLLSPGDPIALEAPTYLGALAAFSPYSPEYICLKSDDQGVIPASLERALKTHAIKLIYLVPTFQNPTGSCLPLERRREIAHILKAKNALLIEDDPYGELRYQGQALPPIKALAPDQVIYTSTFSKILAPGLRVGFYAAPRGIRQWLIRIKQGVDLHSSTLGQALAAEYLSQGFFQAHLPKILSFYAPRKATLERALGEKLPQNFTISPTRGGMFLWVTGPETFDAKALYHRAIKAGVSYVPGCFFHPHPAQGLNSLRLNFTTENKKTLKEGAARLAQVIGSAHPPGE